MTDVQIPTDLDDDPRLWTGESMEAPSEAEPRDLIAVFDQLARANQLAAGEEPRRIAAGTFALYPDLGGGVVLVLNVDEGPAPLLGLTRKKIGPAMIRALQALGDSRNPIKAITALVKGRKSAG